MSLEIFLKINIVNSKKNNLKFIDNFYPQGEVVYTRLIFMKFMNKIKFL